jgi:formylglycine-generating enzyme required for sulfatase activity
MLCPYCKREHPDRAKFCPVTGQSLTLPITSVPASPQRTCISCGASLPPEAQICPVCGTSTVPAGEPGQVPPKASKPSMWIVLGLVVISAIVVICILLLVLVNPERLKAVIKQSFFIGTKTPIYQASLTSTYAQVFPQASPTATASSTPTPTETPLPLITPLALRNNPKDGAEIVLVPEGEFLMGSDPSNDPYFWGAEEPEHNVTLNAFWIYRTEVTQAMYKICADLHACPKPEKTNDPIAQQYGNSRFNDYPVVMVSWTGALSYCQWAGGRLPTEAEWEKAARGTDGRLFPWGNDADATNRANVSTSSPVKVGSFPAGASPYGALDMAGNVLEWVNDTFASGYYMYSPLDNPLGPTSGSRKVIRGGGWNQLDITGLRTVARASLDLQVTKTSVGFRCAVDAP